MQTPHSIPASVQLMDLVIRGNVGHVRNYFDESVAGHSVAHPTWAHLKVALEQGNRQMARLLVTWGAQPTRQELIDYINHRDNIAADVQALKLAGINLTNIDLGITSAASFNHQTQIATPEIQGAPEIPENWKTVLFAFREQDAIIAGGAVRDLLNGRNVNSVDVFIRAPFMRRLFIKRMAETVITSSRPDEHGFSVMSQFSFASVGRDSKGRTIRTERVEKRLGAMNIGHATPGDPLGHTETWQLVDNQGTTYNIIMLDSTLGAMLRQARKDHDTKMIRKFLGCFDIGLCQIAYDGAKIITTDAYNRDAENKTLSIKDPAMTTMEHIAAVISKYPDYTPDSKLADIIKNGRVPARPIPPPPPLPPRVFMR